MTVDLTSRLEATPERVWEALKRTDTIAYLTGGMNSVAMSSVSIGDRSGGIWAKEGNRIEIALPLRSLSAWRHEIEVTRVDETERVIETREHGGPVRSWRHRMSVEPQDGGCCYRDKVEIDAGPATAVVWGLAQMLYRYRHARWRRLAETL